MTSRSTHSHGDFGFFFRWGLRASSRGDFLCFYWEVSIKAGPESWQSLGAVNGGDRAARDGI